jgi:hypothetical protein
VSSKSGPGLCEGCGQSSWLMPLHGPKGGPLRCFMCAGKFHAQRTQQRRWGRIAAKAENLFREAGGTAAELSKWKLAGFFNLSEFCPGYDADGSAGDFTSELLTDTLKLTHPDVHPPERRELATRVTQELVALKPFCFPAPKKPEPKPMEQRDASFKDTRLTSKEPLRITYPCADCASTVPYFYCDACKAEWEKRQHEKRERENAKQRKWYARRKWNPPVVRCAACGKTFKQKRRDAKHCSPACRQRAHRRRSDPPKPTGENQNLGCC